MRKGILLALGIWALAVGPLAAQPFAPPAPGVVPMLPPAGAAPAPPSSEAVGPPAQPPSFPSVPAPQPAYPPGPAPIYPGPMMPGGPAAVMPAPLVLRPVYDPNQYRVWMSAELLLWWVKNAPMPIGVVVSNDPVNNPGGTPLGNNTGSYGAFTGFRFGIGAWLDPDRNLGIEARFFSTDTRTNNFSAYSDAGGNPMLGFPFINQTPGSVGPAVMPITSPGAFNGGISINSSFSLWGTEINGVFRILRVGEFEFTALAGFRYLDMIECLDIQANSQSIADNTLTNFHDSFGTRNQFYGGQLGTRFTWQTDRFSFDIAGKVALGGTYESLNVNGSTLQYPGNSITPNYYPGGFFAQPSNMGRTTATQFGVVPSVELKFAYAITPTCRLFVGYDFLYWNQVIRPGSNVDQHINLSQSAVLNNGVPLGGTVSPAPQFNRTDFWAQGMNLGIEFRF